MSGLISDVNGEALQGSDQALDSTMKPAVEVTFAVAKPGNGAPLDADSGRASRIAAGIRRMRETGSATGKVADPLKVETAVPKEEQPSPDPAPTQAAKATPPASKQVAQPVAEEPPESAADDQVDAAAAEPEPQPEPAKSDEPKADPVEIATLRADLTARNRDLALAHAQLERAQSGHVSEDDRQAWVDNPLGEVRKFIAARIGAAEDAEDIKRELTHLQRELTIEALGLDNLPDPQKHQRTTERYERHERLKQQVRTASQATAQRAQQRTQVVGHLEAAAKAAADEFPHVADASEFYRDPFGTALDLWMTEAQAGRVQVDPNDAKNVREALRLLNDHTKARLDRLTARQPKTTAPAPATAPASASKDEAAKPGAPAANKSTAPKPGSDTPKTLSARQAAAAPPATQERPPERKQTEPLVVDPHDRDGRDKRFISIGRKHLQK